MKKQSLTIETKKQSDLKSTPFSPISDINLTSSAIFSRYVPKDSYLTVDDIVSIDSDEYISSFLNEGELPYWYDISEQINNKSLTVKNGDYISIASVATHPSVPSEFIVTQAKVLKFFESTEKNKSSRLPSYHIILALTLPEILNIERALLEPGKLKLLLTTNLINSGDSDVATYTLTRQVTRGDPIAKSDYEELSNNVTSFRTKTAGFGLAELLSEAVYKNDYPAGTLLTADMIANPNDFDFPLFFLKKNELPYWFDVTELVNSGLFYAKRNDFVSFILVTSPNNSKSNTPKSTVSKVIANDIRVLHLTPTQKMNGEVTYSLVLALDAATLLKLETAKKTGELIVVLSSNLTESGEMKGNFSSNKFDDNGPAVNALRGSL
ncbi:hypothetical protein [Shewanella sairae]|uniref:hypothetical protein n=1 Tax=Shewanella sairae TaxID=190310 RepID=UPI001C822257|nr:hypothetical protein [Shewanella sairae]MCL1132457.1 hypothetical protein [Shewanella sairae]